MGANVIMEDFNRQILGPPNACAYLIVRETMQKAPLAHMFHLEHHIAIPTTTRRGYNILIERERDEHNHGNQIDRSAHGAHALRDLRARRLAHVAAPEAGGHEGRAQPADHGIGEGESGEGERQRGDEGLAIAAKGVGEDGERAAGDGEEGERFGAGERGVDGHFGGQTSD